MRLAISWGMLMAWQTALTPPSPDVWAPLGTLGTFGLSGLIFYFYREDRKASETRYADISKEFRQIVENNTRALDRALGGSLRGPE